MLFLPTASRARSEPERENLFIISVQVAESNFFRWHNRVYCTVQKVWYLFALNWLEITYFFIIHLFFTENYNHIIEVFLQPFHVLFWLLCFATAEMHSWVATPSAGAKGDGESFNSVW